MRANFERMFRLAILVAIVLWFTAAVPLFSHESARPEVLNRYSGPYFLFLVLYVLLLLILILLHLWAQRVFTLVVRHKHALTSSTLALLGMCLSLLLLEAFIRIVDLDGVSYYPEARRYFSNMVSSETLFYEHRPYYEDELQGVTVHINAHGLRDDFHAFKKQDGTIRILMLGDSVTFAWGVEQEDSYSKELESMLAQDGLLQTGKKVEVINAGVGSYNTYQEMNYLKQKGLKYAPDIVVLLYVSNDIEPKKRAGSSDDSQASTASWVKKSIIGSWETVTRKSYLYTYIKARMALHSHKKSEFNECSYDDDPGWLESEAALREMARIYRQEGISFLVFYCCMIDDSHHKTLLPLVRQTGQEENFQTIDLLPYFDGLDLQLITNSKFDPHPNAAGHRIIANAIFDTLVENGLIPVSVEPP